MPHRIRPPLLPPRQRLRRTLRELQARAEAMTCGDFQARGQPVGGPPAVEDLRRAIDVMGEHLAQAQRAMHSCLTSQRHDGAITPPLAPGLASGRQGRLSSDISGRVIVPSGRPR